MIRSCSSTIAGREDPCEYRRRRCHTPSMTAIPSFQLTVRQWLRRDRMRGQDSHETMKVRPFSGHIHRRGKASPRGVPVRR